MTDKQLLPCGEKSSKCTECTGTYYTSIDFATMGRQRYVGYYMKDGAMCRCKQSGCPIHRDPIYERVADRLEGKKV